MGLKDFFCLPVGRQAGPCPAQSCLKLFHLDPAMPFEVENSQHVSSGYRKPWLQESHLDFVSCYSASPKGRHEDQKEIIYET